jgi:hypothetical protein
MGFSGIPPRPDQAAVLPTIAQWASRADAAILHISPPWSALLSGTGADAAVRAAHLPLVDQYRKPRIQRRDHPGCDRRA